MHQLVASPDRGEAKAIPGRALTILLCSAGRRVGLLRAFRRAAADLHADLRILACDARPDWSAACRFADAAFATPYADDPEFVPTIEAICRENGVSLVVPTIDPELQALAAVRDHLAITGTAIAVSAPAVIEICRDKLRTAQFLAQHGVPVPRTQAYPSARQPDWNGPVIVKPRHGSAGRAIARFENMDAVVDPVAEPMIVQELLEGEEWTVNLYFDGAGVMRSVVPHHRLQVRAGEVEKGVTGRPEPLIALAEAIAQCLPGPRGALCYQAIVDAEGSAKVFEINARFGGGYPLADHAGASFARWLLEERLNLPSTAGNKWTAGVAMLRFDAELFVNP